MYQYFDNLFYICVNFDVFEILGMIERRKTNLKEEIENSEKKARKTANEEAQEEESENIPEDSEENHPTEQQMREDFEEENNKNVYLEGT